MLDPLIDRKDGQVPGSRQPAMVEDRSEVTQNADGSIGAGDDLLDEGGTRQVQHVPGDRLATMVQQVIRFRPQNRPPCLVHFVLLVT
jgi:hypothetical protein